MGAIDRAGLVGQLMIAGEPGVVKLMTTVPSAHGFPPPHAVAAAPAVAGRRSSMKHWLGTPLNSGRVKVFAGPAVITWALLPLPGTVLLQSLNSSVG